MLNDSSSIQKDQPPQTFHFFVGDDDDCQAAVENENIVCNLP